MPGLAAKPIIDIVLVGADSSDEAGYVPDLQDAGYVQDYADAKSSVVEAILLRAQTDQQT